MRQTGTPLGGLAWRNDNIPRLTAGSPEGSR